VYRWADENNTKDSPYWNQSTWYSLKFEEEADEMEQRSMSPLQPEPTVQAREAFQIASLNA